MKCKKEKLRVYSPFLIGVYANNWRNKTLSHKYLCLCKQM